MQPARPLPHLECPLCGQPNDCIPARCGRFDVDCWCSAARIDPATLASVAPALRGKACLCPRCAAAQPASQGLPADGWQAPNPELSPRTGDA